MHEVNLYSAHKIIVSLYAKVKDGPVADVVLL